MTIKKSVVKRWMQENTGEASDSAGEVSPTKLAEIADVEFDISNAPDYEIPQWVWEMAAQVAEKAG